MDISNSDKRGILLYILFSISQSMLRYLNQHIILMQFEGKESESNISCMDQFLGVWGTTTRRRVLSDKQLKKQKKLNLSLLPANCIKPNRKLALACSFLKTEPSHHQKHEDTRPNSEQKQIATTITKQKQQSIEKSQINYPKWPEMGMKILQSSHPSKHLHSTTVTCNPFVKMGLKVNHSISNKKPPNFLIDSSRKVDENSSRQKTKVNSFQKSPFQQKNMHRISELSEEFPRNSQFFIDQAQDSNISSQLTKEQRQECSGSLNKIQITSPYRKITNLNEGAATIVSKFDSSRKSESINTSNVIFRLMGDSSLKKSRHTFNKLSSTQKNNEKSFIDNLNGTQRPYNGSFRKSKDEKMSHQRSSSGCKKLNKAVMDLMNSEDYQCSIQLRLQNNNMSCLDKINYLGVGRFGNVYLVKDRQSGFLLAVKQIFKFTIECNSLHQELMRQIQIQAKICHPNVISLYYASADAKKYYIYLEYGETNLMSLLRKAGSFSEQQSRQYLRDIVAGLGAIHTAGAVHRDIKPDNIIVSDGTCKIADFGWAEWTRVTRFLGMRGTTGYCSPQVMKMEKYTQKTDCWSLGVLAYELVAGPLNDYQFQDGILNTKMIDYENLKVSIEYKRMLRRMLQTRQEDRPSIHEINQDVFFTAP